MTQERPLTQIEEDRKRQRELQAEAMIQEQQRLIQLTATVCSTSDGIEFMQRLMNKCGHLKTSVVMLPGGEISPLHTMWQEGRKSLWLELRNTIPADKINEIESQGVGRVKQAPKKKLRRGED